MRAGERERAVLLAAAGVELLRAHALLAEHAVALGYADKLLQALAEHLPAPAAASTGTGLQGDPIRCIAL